MQRPVGTGPLDQGKCARSREFVNLVAAVIANGRKLGKLHGGISIVVVGYLLFCGAAV
jgi:hypothetical protein